MGIFFFFEFFFFRFPIVSAPFSWPLSAFSRIVSSGSWRPRFLLMSPLQMLCDPVVQLASCLIRFWPNVRFHPPPCRSSENSLHYSVSSSAVLFFLQNCVKKYTKVLPENLLNLAWWAIFVTQKQFHARNFRYKQISHQNGASNMSFKSTCRRGLNEKFKIIAQKLRKNFKTFYFFSGDKNCPSYQIQ